MKKILFIIVVLVITVLHLKAQAPKKIIVQWDPVDTVIHYVPRILFDGRDSTIIYIDDFLIWSMRTQVDTITFIHPPKHIIVGINSYTSLYLNGNWVLLMDPTNLK